MPSDEYLEGSFYVQGRDFVDAGVVSSEIKKKLKEKGIRDSIIRKAAVVTFEAEINIISYAEQGTIQYYIDQDSITIEAKDSGAGIVDIELALQEGYSTADDSIRELGFGAGMGLANIKRFSDEFEISSVPTEGTFLRCTIYLNGK